MIWKGAVFEKGARFPEQTPGLLLWKTLEKLRSGLIFGTGSKQSLELCSWKRGTDDLKQGYGLKCGYIPLRHLMTPNNTWPV